MSIGLFICLYSAYTFTLKCTQTLPSVPLNHMHMHIHSYTFTHSCTNSHTHTHTLTHIRTHTYTHRHTHTHTHTQSRTITAQLRILPVYSYVTYYFIKAINVIYMLAFYNKVLNYEKIKDYEKFRLVCQFIHCQ